MASQFDQVDPKVDFVANEEAILKWWEENDIPARYRKLNDDKEKKFSFIDGPITANNPMGVHHVPDDEHTPSSFPFHQECVEQTMMEQARESQLAEELYQTPPAIVFQGPSQ